MARERSGHRPRFRLAPMQIEALVEAKSKRKGTNVPDQETSNSSPGQTVPVPGFELRDEREKAFARAEDEPERVGGEGDGDSDGDADDTAADAQAEGRRALDEALEDAAEIEEIVATDDGARAGADDGAEEDDSDAGTDDPDAGAEVDSEEAAGADSADRASASPRDDAETALELAGVRKTTDPIESYEDRLGYRPDFIGEGLEVPLPKLSAALSRDAVAFTWKGRRTRVLDYTHFSTVVSKSRRLPLLSACNLDGSRPREVDRSSWRRDPRIPAEYQLLDGVYGNERNGFFSRGHMTRRRDVLWGSKQAARQANADTFHATNAAPQVQRFNGGVWNELEDYILANSRKDLLRISVFTGPVFSAEDPTLHGVKIPLRFWKVLAFVHRQSGRLSAVGYLASQATEVSELKSFAFGAFMDQQRPLTAIEKLTGLSFGALTAADVLLGASDNFAVALDDVRDVLLD